MSIDDEKQVHTGDLLCAWCEEHLDDEEKESPQKDNDGDIICDNCYDEHYRYACPLCSEFVEKEGNQEHIALTNALAEDQEMEPGIYKVLQFPWFSSDCFSMHIYELNVKKVKDLPKELQEETEGNYICEDCVKSA